MKCGQCKHDLPEGAKRCPVCGHVDGWDMPCPRCHCLIHKTSTFCIHCKNDITPKSPGWLERLSRKITLPVAMVGSVVALLVPVVGLILTLKAEIDTTPVISVFPEASGGEAINLMFYNAGEKVAHIESARLQVFVDGSARHAQQPEENAGWELVLKEKENAILNPKANSVKFMAKETSWVDPELNALSPNKLFRSLADRTSCNLSLVIRDSRSKDVIQPGLVTLIGDECSTFIAFRFGRGVEAQ